ncbi:uncharacterized protein L199_008022 [Kwoniella botswanensis]|uniref:uncharacterized protein n=1 Tax=Kwoniella botswanensis TaxID=1268659 RepID=UPI00315C94E3
MKLLKGNVIGLDVEYIEEISEETHHPTKKPALLQLCDEHSVLLIQLKNGLESRLPRRTLQLLCDPKIIKVGVGIHNDCASLVRAYRDRFFQNGHIIRQPVSILELSHLAHELDRPSTWESGYYSLAGLCERYLGKKLCKNGNSHRGGWSDRLSEKQINYAANDVTSALQIFLKLKSRADKMGKKIDIGKLCQPIDVPAICRKANVTHDKR